MRIWHVGASHSPERVNGVNATIWQVAEEQALLGHKVVLVLRRPPDDAALDLAGKTGIELVHIPAYAGLYRSRALRELLTSEPPQIVHMHSVFVSEQVALTRLLMRNDIPYVITPHGVADQMLKRGLIKKRLYGWLIEKRRFNSASAITAVSPAEGGKIRNFVPHYTGTVRWIPNPVATEDLGAQGSNDGSSKKILVYLGRFDVLHKGIDTLIDIARFLPEVEVRLYGTEDARTRGWLNRLKRDLPPNVSFHRPVFGSEKHEVLRSASIYIQTSRWEVFGISVAEAMCLGTPCAIAETMDLSELFRQHDLGLLLPTDTREAADRLLEALDQPARLENWSTRARVFARENFHPRQVAQSYLTLYKEVLNSRDESHLSRAPGKVVRVGER